MNPQPIRYWLSKAGPAGLVCGAKQGDVHVTNWYAAGTEVTDMVRDIRVRLAMKIAGTTSREPVPPPASAELQAYEPVTARLVKDAPEGAPCPVCGDSRRADCERYPGDTKDGVAPYCPQAIRPDHHTTMED